MTSEPSPTTGNVLFSWPECDADFRVGSLRGPLPGVVSTKKEPVLPIGRHSDQPQLDVLRGSREHGLGATKSFLASPSLFTDVDLILFVVIHVPHFSDLKVDVSQDSHRSRLTRCANGYIGAQTTRGQSISENPPASGTSERNSVCGERQLYPGTCSFPFISVSATPSPSSAELVLHFYLSSWPLISCNPSGLIQRANGKFAEVKKLFRAVGTLPLAI
ncbi:hypothetical protein B0H11DRAFT_1924791 [Mycena galericulata]|nr:hypothetical protein B0H11DRAFT_1924791 [Mycena galericulata]